MRHSRASGDEETVSVILPLKEIEPYEHVFKNNTEFFSTYNPDMIEEAILHHLKYKENV